MQTTVQVSLCSVLICHAKGSDSPSFHPLTVDDGEDGVFGVHVAVHFRENLELMRFECAAIV